jgi:DNA-binding MarR family transcriptional regulator
VTGFDHTRLDDLIHSRIRLAIMAVLSAVDRAEFTYLRDVVKTTDGNLGAHLGKLEAARYVAVDKRFVARRPVSYYRLTATGRKAFDHYLKTLDALLKARPSV